VIGVGALDRKNRPAAYSNYADNPLYEGIAAFGGLADMATDTADPNDGIAGLYIGNFLAPQRHGALGRNFICCRVSAGCWQDWSARVIPATGGKYRSERKFDVPDVVTTDEQ
jgi:hypothetical protein